MGSPLIAVINDDAALVELLTDLLTAEGCRVITAGAGVEAYQLVRAQQPELVLLDQSVEQPGAAWRVLELLQLDPATNKTPVIFCSVDAQLLAQKREQLRIHDIICLEKPFHREKLVATIGAVLANLPNDEAQLQVGE